LRRSARNISRLTPGRRSKNAKNFFAAERFTLQSVARRVHASATPPHGKLAGVRRWLFNLAATVSLALCVAVMALWVSSYRVAWQRHEMAYRQIVDLLDDEHHPYLADVTVRGLLLERSRLIMYRLKYCTNPGERARIN
jgi:hypothetical protein